MAATRSPGCAALLVLCVVACREQAAAPTALAPGASADAATPAAPAHAEKNRIAVDRLAQAIEERYSYRDRLGVDWATGVAAHRPALEAAASADEFAREAAVLLGAAQDVHIWIDVGGQRLPTHRSAAVANATMPMLRKAVRDWKPRGRCLALGRLGEDVGYVLVTSLERGKCDDLPEAFAAALADLDGVRALVIDLRGNQGGDERLAQGMAGRLVDAPVLYARHEFRDSSAPGGFAPRADRVLQPTADAPRWRGPVVALMGPLNMSSAEAFLLMLRAAGAKLVGGRSMGASGNPQPVDLGNGVVVFLPSWRALLPDGTGLEGVGLAPDVMVSDADFSQRDPVIDAALASLAP